MKLLDAPPDVRRMHFHPGDLGTADNGMIWVNGIIFNFGEDGNFLSMVK